MNRETIIEAMARAICSSWAGGSDQKDWGGLTERSRASARHDAEAALAAIEAAGVRLVPERLTKEMCYACMTSDQLATGMDRVDYHSVLHRRYAAQLAASPYAKDNGNG